MNELWPRRRLPVLMYHRVGDAVGDAALWVSRAAFARQLDWLAEGGYDTLTLDRAFAVWRRRRVPRRAVLLTFDDAFSETLAVAGPMLAERGLTAAVFAPAGLLGRTVSLGPPGGDAGREASPGRIADAGELAAWLALGHDLGCHSLTHRALPGLPAAEAEREVAEAKTRLEAAVGRPVPDFCYPYARHDAAARRLVAAAGYRAAYAGEPPCDDLFALPRMMVFPTDGPARFRRKLSGHYYWLSAWHRLLGGRVRG